MVRHLGRIGLLALVVIVFASALTTLPSARAASPSSYTLTGFIEQPSGADVYRGVQVDLVSQATGATFVTTTGAGGLGPGEFQFTSGSTSYALQPGYWGIYIPPQGNTSLTGLPPGNSPCKPCAALPSNQNPVFGFYTSNAAGVLSTTGPAYTTVSIFPYSVTISGTVELAGSPLGGAPVQLLAPTYNGVVLYNTTSNSTTGAFSIKSPYTTFAPSGQWVLQAYNPGPPNQQNTTKIVVTSGTTLTVNPNIQSYFVSGRMLASAGAGVPTPGNATLVDTTTGFIYSVSTFPGGYYELGTYGLNFGSGSNSFDLFLSAAGYATVEHSFAVSSPTTPISYSPVLPRLAPTQRGAYNTTLDFTGFHNATGTGNLSVNSTATLGNDTVLTNLPNGTVSQLWAQLGLDFNNSSSVRSPSIPGTLVSAFFSWVNSTGPLFPVVQPSLPGQPSLASATTINGTGFVAPTTPQTLSSWSSGCTTKYCGGGTTGNVTLGWSTKYALNGTVAINSSTYSIGFGFRHPVSSADIYNYTVELPKGYVLKAGTPVPTDARLIPLGVNGTWNNFTLESLYDPVPSANISFTIVSATTLVAIVNVTVPSYFAFSNQNVLNSTRGNYTVEVGINQNVTFSALNTIYPTGINGTKFTWTFGDGTGTNVTVDQTYHYYRSATASGPDKGLLTVVSSNHVVDSTKFFVWVATGPVTPGILSNASAYQNRTVNSVPYVFVNWSTVLHFNATGSKALITPSTTTPKGVLSVASFTLVSSKGFSVSANYSESAGAAFGSNWTYQFLGAGSYLTNGTVSGNLVPFKGWQYNLTLKVWSGTGQTESTTLVILVNDTEKPVATFNVLNSAGSPVSGKSVIALSNLSAQVQLNASGSMDPHNGSIVRYYWLIGLTKNGTFHVGTNVTSVKPYPKFWLTAQVNPYWVNLTVFDLNGNHGYSNQTLTVAANSTTTPILAANNLTGPTKVSSGSSYTFWVNVTVGGGSKSTALDVAVTWYTTAPGGTARSYIAGSPGSVTFYNYTSPGVVNPVSMARGSIASLAYNTTVRAVITWSPSSTGNFQLYANATASNEFAGDYSSGTNVASMAITVSPNPTTQLLEYIAIGVAVVAVILAIVFYVRRRGRPGKAAKSTGKSGLERGAKRAADEEEADEAE